jgi:hypothetical protein
LFLAGCVVQVLETDKYDGLVADPPDEQNAARIAFPRPVSLPRIASRRCAAHGCAALRQLEGSYISAAARVASIARAMAETGDRFSGAGQLAPTELLRSEQLEVLQSAVVKARAGELADAINARQHAGATFAAALKRAHVSLTTSDTQAQADAQRLTRLEGLPPSLLAALQRNGLSQSDLRYLFAAAIGHVSGDSLHSELTRGESTTALRRLYCSLTVPEIGYIENALFNAKDIPRRIHAKLHRDLLTGVKTSGARRVAVRRFLSHARGVSGEAATLLRDAGKGLI